MKTRTTRGLAAVLISLFALALSGCRTRTAAPSALDYPIRPVPFTQVRLTDSFWAPRLETNRDRLHSLRPPHE